MTGGLLGRVRWVNLARLLFALATLALLAGGVPRLGGSAGGTPDLGLPDAVLRPSPAAPAPQRVSPPAPLRRLRPDRPAARGHQVRRRAIPPRRRAPRPAPNVVPVSPAPASPPAAPPAAAPPVGEFGP